MALDVDFVCGQQAIRNMEKLLRDIPHGEREAIAADIIAFANRLKKKYSKKKV